MKMEKRDPKKTDQEQIEIAFRLLKECINNHSEIERTLWAGACWSLLIEGYITSGVSYDQFTTECDQVKHHYKSRFDK